MPVLPNTIGAGSAVFLDSTGKLPAVDGSQLTNISPATLPTVMVPNLIQDNLAQPPTIAGTVAVTNGSASVAGTATLFTTSMAVGMIIRFGSQPTANYTVSAITSNLAITISPAYTGTTNLTTTVVAAREDDAYIVGASPSGAWASFSQGDLIVWTGSTPPGSLTAGTWLLVSAGTGGVPSAGISAIICAFQGTGAGSFSGQDGKIARYSGSWSFITPGAGQVVAVTNGPLQAALGLYDTVAGVWKIVSNEIREAVVTGSITTTGTTDQANTLTQLLPSAGTYNVTFITSAGNSNNGQSVTVDVRVSNGTNANGTIVSGSAVLIITGAANRGCVSTEGKAVPSGIQSIAPQWHVSANTGTMLDRFLRIRRVA